MPKLNLTSKSMEEFKMMHVYITQKYLTFLSALMKMTLIPSVCLLPEMVILWFSSSDK